MMVNLYKSLVWPHLEQCVSVSLCGLLIIRRIKNYWKERNIDLQEWLTVFRLCIWR